MSSGQQVSSYSQIYRDIKKTIHYHRQDTYWSCAIFLLMQYSIPVLSAFLTAVIGTKMFSENVVLYLGILLTVLGTFNSILKPAEGYEWAASFSNKFEEFENDLNLSMIELGAISETKESDYIQLLRTTNHNLAKLIDERNQRQIAFFRSRPTEEP